MRDLAVQLYREAVNDRINGVAAEVAFFAVLSIFPGLLIVAAGLGSFDALVGSDVAARTQQQIRDFLNLILTDQALPAIEAVENLFERESSGLLTAASVAALYGLSRGFVAVVRALNLAYDVEERRVWLKVRLLGLALALGSAVMAIVTLTMIVLGPLFGGGERLAELFGLGNAFALAWELLRWPVAFALLVAWATTLFHLAPNRERKRWRDDLGGALFTAVLWLVVSAGFALYLRVAGQTNPIFGVLGGGLILLVWLYLLSLSLLLGGELNALVTHRKGDAPEPPA